MENFLPQICGLCDYMAIIDISDLQVMKVATKLVQDVKFWAESNKDSNDAKMAIAKTVWKTMIRIMINQ